MEIKDTKYANDMIATFFLIIVDSVRNPENDFYIFGRKAINFGISRIKILMYQHKLLLIRLLSNKYN